MDNPDPLPKRSIHDYPSYPDFDIDVSHDIIGQLNRHRSNRHIMTQFTPNPGSTLQSVQPAQPVTPAQPVQPVQPVTPAQPVQPVQSVQPAQPVTPAQPVQPVQSVQPVQPVTPAQPAQPVSPVSPNGPTDHTYKIEIDVSKVVSGSKTLFGMASGFLGSAFKQTSHLASNASRIALDAASSIGSSYEQSVPPHIKEKIDEMNEVRRTMADTAKTVVQNAVQTAATQTSNTFGKSIRPVLYDHTTKISSKLSRMTELYVLREIPDNSTILHVGIGTAYPYYAYGSDIIKARNLKIVGVDSDEGYILKAKHGAVDHSLEKYFEFYHLNIENVLSHEMSDEDYATISKLTNVYDYVVITDYYSIVSNPSNLLRWCEHFINDMGYMIICTTLFDEYDYTLDIIKQNLKFVSGVEFGRLVLKSDLEDYILNERLSTDYEIKQVAESSIGIGPISIPITLKTYIIRWRPCDDR